MYHLAKKESAHTTRQQGAMLIFILIMLPILIATMGLALDVGKFFIVKSELQNSADACALAAAYELDGTSSQFTRAEAAGLNLAAKNNVYFQQGAVAGTAVQFSTTANGGYASAGAAAAVGKYEREESCVSRRDVRRRADRRRHRQHNAAGTDRGIP